MVSVTKSISSPPRMGCQSAAGLFPSVKFASTHLNTWVEKRHFESEVSCLRTQQTIPSQFSNPDCLIWRQTYQP